MARVNGTVKFFNHSRRLRLYPEPEDGGKDVFVHASALERSGVPALNEGDRSLRDRGRSSRPRTRLPTSSSPSSRANCA